ncbi:NAD(P)-dependent oxidoreductase [Rhodococcus sp. NPDC057529]|uniref:NAD(P)-dependent oxidoreductase n=1 Tax=Rhodococcus sp. NPDC057529 TaxID=3346158 RepID=UPI0036732183
MRSTENPKATIAWIGLGIMGGPMASNLVRAGHTVLGVDPSEQARTQAGEAGVHLSESVADAVRSAHVVFTMLPTGDHVKTVLDGPDGVWQNAPRGALIIDASTVDVSLSRWCHEESRIRGFDFIDAPVSGGGPGAAAGTLTVMVGGTAEVLDRAEPVLAPLASSVIRAGGPTAGIAAKICNNMMLFTCLMATAEGSQLAQHLGLDPQVFWEIASVSSGSSWPLKTWYPVPGVVETAPANRNFAPNFPVQGALKDMTLALAAGQETGVNLPAARLAADQFQTLIDEGLAGRDCSLIAKLASPTGAIAGFDENK